MACARLGRIDETKAIFEEVLAKMTRLVGRDYPYTQSTRKRMVYFGIAVPPSG